MLMEFIMPTTHSMVSAEFDPGVLEEVDAGARGDQQARRRRPGR